MDKNFSLTSKEKDQERMREGERERERERERENEKCLRFRSQGRLAERKG